MKRRSACTAVAAVIAFLVLSVPRARVEQQPNPAERFEVSDVMIPVRDGVKLHTKIIDRNPQTFVPNRFHAKESDFKAATPRVHRTMQHPSRAEVAVVRVR